LRDFAPDEHALNIKISERPPITAFMQWACNMETSLS